MRDNFPRIMMGTAQFGQKYGVANRHGPPDFAGICRMLEQAA